MFGRHRRRFRETALGPVVVIWAFGYLLVDIFAFLWPGPPRGCSSSSPPDDSAERRDGTGIGLANIRQRVAIRCGSGAALETGPVAHGWRAEIRLPMSAGSARPG